MAEQIPTKQEGDPLAGRFNGSIKTDEGVIEVKGGFGVIDGELYMISDDGVVVTDKNGNIVAVVVNGKASKLTPEIINQLRRKGYIQ